MTRRLHDLCLIRTSLKPPTSHTSALVVSTPSNTARLRLREMVMRAWIKGAWARRRRRAWIMRPNHEQRPTGVPQ